MPPCISFHAPHGRDLTNNWWETFSIKFGKLLTDFQKKCPIITVENMPDFIGFYNPLKDPEDLKSFTELYDLGITFDTTHYAEIGINIVDTLKILNKNIRTIHLSDFSDEGSHLLIGEGDINWKDFFKNLNYSNLHTITLECSMANKMKSIFKMTKSELIARLIKAKTRLTDYLK